MVNRLALGVGAATLVALIIVIIFFSNKTGSRIECTATTACADKWVDSSDNPIASVKQTCSADGKIVNPVGPGKCTNPCPAGQVACWSAGENLGRCVIGTSCPPCFTDADCGGTAKGKCNIISGATSGNCVCTLPNFGVNCQTTDCNSGDNPCGKNGTCSADGKSCVCKPGWADSATSGPCSVCADDLANNNAWGPPGVCNYKRFAPGQQKDGLWGAALPLPTNAHYCDNLSNAKFNAACIAEYGSEAYFPPEFSSTNAPGTEDDYICGPYPGNACTSYNYYGSQMLCWVPGGYYGQPDSDPSKYSPCAIGPDGKTAKPPGYVRPLNP